MADIVSQLADLKGALASALRSRGEFFAQRVDHLSASLATSLTLVASNAANRVERAKPRLSAALTLRLQRDTARLEKAEARLVAYSPYGVLERGYSLTTAADGSVVRDAATLAKGDVITTRFARGSTSSAVLV